MFSLPVRFRLPLFGGLDWFGFGLEPLVFVEGRWETPQPLNHQSKPPSSKNNKSIAPSTKKQRNRTKKKTDPQSRFGCQTPTKAEGPASLGHGLGPAEPNAGPGRTAPPHRREEAGGVGGRRLPESRARRRNSNPGYTGCLRLHVWLKIRKLGLGRW